jgi:hypothetical protein
MQFLLSLLNGRNIVVKLNLIIKFLFRNNNYEYQIIKSSSLQKIRYLFDLLQPVNNGYELIRIGSAHDGGYLLPNDFREIRTCYSAGVGASTEFEDQLQEFNIKSFLADPTIPDNYDFNKEYNIEKIPISGATGDILKLKMFGDTDGPDLSFQGTSLMDWVNSKSISGNDDAILKLDIEGGEYSALLSTPVGFLNKFRIICIELHSFPNIRNSYFLENQMIPLLEKLKSNFDIVHIHPNNVAPSIKFLKLALPHAIEVTLHRKDRRNQQPVKLDELSHPLDSETLPDKPNVKFDLSS